MLPLAVLATEVNEGHRFGRMMGDFCIWLKYMEIFRNTDGKDPSPVDVVVYPRIYRVLYIPGGAGFLPTVSHEIQDAGSSPPG